MERIKRILLRILNFLKEAAQLVWELLLAPFQYIHLALLLIFDIVILIYKLVYKLDKLKFTKWEWDVISHVSFASHILGWAFVIYCLVTSSFIDYYFPTLRSFLNYIEYMVIELTYTISNTIDSAYNFAIEFIYLIIAFVAKVFRIFNIFK